jgi:hypothetical protein
MFHGMLIWFGSVQVIVRISTSESSDWLIHPEVTQSKRSLSRVQCRHQSLPTPNSWSVLLLFDTGKMDMMDTIIL